MSGSEAATAVVMVVGPSDAQLALRTLRVLLAVAPEVDIYLLDDCTSNGTFDALTSFAREHAGVSVERNSSPNGYHGIAHSVARLLRVAHSAGRYDMVVKIDPDGMIIDGGYFDIVRARFLEFGPGVAGTFRLGPTGGPRRFRREWRQILADLMPLGPTRASGRSVRIGSVGFARHLPRALIHRYRLGEHVQGGVYALHRDTLIALTDSGYLAAIENGVIGMVWSDDLLLSLGVRSVGHSLIDINTDTTRCWLQYRSPLPLAPEDIERLGLLALHPVKAGAGDALRATVEALVDSHGHVARCRVVESGWASAESD